MSWKPLLPIIILLQVSLNAGQYNSNEIPSLAVGAGTGIVARHLLSKPSPVDPFAKKIATLLDIHTSDVKNIAAFTTGCGCLYFTANTLATNPQYIKQLAKEGLILTAAGIASFYILQCLRKFTTLNPWLPYKDSLSDLILKLLSTYAIASWIKK